MITRSIRVGSILLSLCQIVIGVLLLIDPEGFTAGIITFLGVILLVAGVVSVVRYFQAEPAVAALEQGLTRGIIEIAIGLFCVLNSRWFITIVPLFTVIYGVVTLGLGIAKVQWTADMLRGKVKKWGWVAADAVITILCAAVILCNPFSSTAILWMFVAISLIVEAVADIFIAIFAKNRA